MLALMYIPHYWDTQISMSGSLVSEGSKSKFRGYSYAVVKAISTSHRGQSHKLQALIGGKSSSFMLRSSSIISRINRVLPDVTIQVGAELGQTPNTRNSKTVKLITSLITEDYRGY